MAEITFFQIEGVSSMLKLATTLENEFGFLHQFLKKQLASKPNGMCVVSSWSTTPDAFGLYVVHANLDHDDSELRRRGALSCNLDAYHNTANMLLGKPCKKTFQSATGTWENIHPASLPGSAVMSTGKGNYVIFPLDEQAYPTVLDFIADATFLEKQNFWRNVSLAILTSLQTKKPFQLTIHVGPCYHQGNPVFHVKVGPTVGSCIAGEHFKLECAGHHGLEKDKFNMPP